MKRKPYAIDDRQTPETPSRNPWKWIPTLYFAEALPYVTVMSISTVMYERMGLSNAEIAFYTSALYLPWVVKPLWSPFIDLAKSKRWWILAMEFLIAAAIAGVAFTLPSAHFLVFTLMFLWMMAFSSATHDIAADGFYMLALDPHEQSLYVGIRSTFYRIATIAGSGLLIMLAGTLETFTRRIAYSWSIAFYVLAAFFIAVTAYHFFHLPRPDCDRTRKAVSARSLWKDIWLTVTSFFRKPQPVAAVLFMLFYRLPEALLIRISNLFLIKPVSEGGLGLSTQEVGFVQGTVGVLGLTLGGIIGGIAASRNGLKKWLWPMVWSITLPDLVYVYLSYFQSTNFLLINAMVFIEQFGYGFGFTAYMLFLLYYSQGEQQTSHYAFCTAFMALSMMLPGAVAGELQEAVGYFHFFLIVMACCLVTVGVTALLKIDPEFGKKNIMETKHNLRKALLVADGGSTKTDWCLAVPHREPQLFRTRGLNPALLEPPAIREILQTELLPRLAPHLQGPETETHIYYYGAGCLPSVCDKMGQALTGLFPRSTAEVHSDLLGAARALCGHEAGIACILGTGSNSCRYDGQDIVQHVSPLGYILGDEGSRHSLGKRLIGDWLKGLLDEELSRKLAESYGWDEADIIRKVYREPEANRFLASFTPFLKTHRTHPDAHRILTDCFKAFFERNIMAYHPGSLAVHFVGSIAAIFHQELEEAAGIYDIRIGNILKEPIDRMVNYHRQKLKDKAD